MLLSGLGFLQNFTFFFKATKYSLRQVGYTLSLLKLDYYRFLYQEKGEKFINLRGGIDSVSKKQPLISTLFTMKESP